MYHGKYAPGYNGRKKKLSSILFASIVLILALSIGTTLAYLLDHTGSITNTFTPANVDVTVQETFSNNIKQHVGAKNTGDISVYVRLTLVEYWKKGNEIVAKPSGGSVDKEFVNTNLWIEKNGIYYYTSPLAPHASTGDLIETVTVTCPEGYQYYLDVYTEVIQAEPTTAVTEAWKVTLDGTTIKAVN